MMCVGHEHVVLIIRAPDGEVDVAYSRFSRGPLLEPSVDRWRYFEKQLAADPQFGVGHTLLAVVADEEHDHPMVLTSTGFHGQRHMS